jgi:DNA-binding CsgD family transcriptional regulator
MTVEAQPKQLSHREMEVAELVARALNNSEIARSLCVSEHTVKHHLSRIFLKLRLRDREALIVWWWSKIRNAD